MPIDWLDLGRVFGATVAATVGVVVLFGFGLIGLSRRAVPRARGGSGAAPFAGAMICFVLCVALIGFGIWVLVRG
jgi:hypothetical protein